MNDLAFALVRIILVFYVALAGWEDIRKRFNP
jgi:hypothetical protein